MADPEGTPRVRHGVLHGVRCHLRGGAHKAHPFIRGDQTAWCHGDASADSEAGR